MSEGTSPGDLADCAGKRTLEQAFSSRDNSLNFLRLCLALAVIAGHAIGFAWLGDDTVLSGKTTIGTLAVYGFFGISGFLIARSASRNNVGRYLWQRFLRIFPAFWVCLIVTAVLFGSIGWHYAKHAPGCATGCYLSRYPVPYVASNFFLRINQSFVGGSADFTQHGPNLMQNAALWSLFYEFLCYIAIAVLALIGLLRRRFVVATMTAALWVAQLVITVEPHHGLDPTLALMIMLGCTFLTGSVLYLYADKVPDSSITALACVVLFVASVWLPAGIHQLSDRPTSIDLAAPLLAYPLLWLGIHLPCRRIGARNDYSYGLYIYGTPVLVVLTYWHVPQWGYVPYLAMTVLGTFAFAVTSWWLLEKHALRLKKLDWRTLGRTPRTSTSARVEPDEPSSSLPLGVASEPAELS